MKADGKTVGRVMALAFAGAVVGVIAFVIVALWVDLYEPGRWASGLTVPVLGILGIIAIAGLEDAKIFKAPGKAKKAGDVLVTAGVTLLIAAVPSVAIANNDDIYRPAELFLLGDDPEYNGTMYALAHQGAIKTDLYGQREFRWEDLLVRIDGRKHPAKYLDYDADGKVDFCKSDFFSVMRCHKHREFITLLEPVPGDAGDHRIQVLVGGVVLAERRYSIDPEPVRGDL